MASDSDPQPPPRTGQEEVLPVALRSLDWSGSVYGRRLKKSLRERADAGEKKYGTRLMTFNGRDAITDAFQEAQDALMYLTQAQMEAQGKDLRLGDIIARAQDLALDIAYHMNQREKPRD